MKKMASAFFTALFICSTFILCNALAEEKATKEECLAMVQKAVQLVNEIGLEATLKRLNDKKSEFVWKDSYVICVELEEGTMLAHAINPKLVGIKLKSIKDKDGKMFVAEYLHLAKTKNAGWVTYMWPRPGEKKPSKKTAYVQRVPNESVLMLAGVYE